MTSFYVVVLIVFLSLIIGLAVLAWRFCSSLPAQLSGDRSRLVNQTELALAGNWARLCLRRSSTLAPLLGLALTAWSFWTYDGSPLATETGVGLDGSSDFLTRLQPLYGGVLVGTVLAIVSQIANTVVDYKVGRVRAWAVEKAGPAQVSEADQNPYDMVGEILQGMCDAASVRLTRMLDEGYKGLGDFSKSARASAEALRLATTDLQQVRTGFTTLAQDLNSASDRISQQIVASSEGLARDTQQLGSTLSQGASSYATATTTIQVTARQFEGVVKSLIPLVERMGEQVGGLQQASGQYSQAAIATLQAVRQFGDQLSGEVRPTLDSAATALEATTKKLDQVSSQTGRIAESLDGVTTSWTKSAENLTRSSDKLGSTLPTITTEFAKLPGELSQVVASLGDAPRRFSEQFAKLQEATTAAIKEQGEQTRNFTVNEGRQVFQQLSQEVQTMMRELQQAGGEMRKASQGLNAAVQDSSRTLSDSAGKMTTGFDQFSQQLGVTLREMRAEAKSQNQLGQQLTDVALGTRETNTNLQRLIGEVTRALQLRSPPKERRPVSTEEAEKPETTQPVGDNTEKRGWFKWRS